jgi:hypothetical protein
MLALAKGKIDLINLLLDSGVQIQIRTATANSPFMSPSDPVASIA